jgi:large subunit ribosomal protein L1
VEFRTDKGANLHVPVGKVSFDEQQLVDNVTAILDSVNKMKPSASKGQYVRNIVLSSTMGPGVKVDVAVKAL